MASGATTETRRLEVAPGRFTGWIESFADRHQGLAASFVDDVVTFTAPDGAVAECLVPFPPLPVDDGAEPLDLAKLVSAHATADRTVGVFLVRLGGYGAGVFTGSEPTLVASKVGSRLVHGRSAAGGQSQQRFARRRENQAHQALSAAADTAAAVFGPYKLDALVLGGDKRAFTQIRNDPRLTPFFEVAVESFLTVPDPRLTVLKDTPRLFRAIKIKLTQPTIN
ncbi:MAG TPA: acVLRF1 family peptidyl-tRNA hydrolase [Streptosporangiaceae bacterium]|nr:acVLRF1 family peptidyl-tRNA hydrolase [Streptosporangiaceae bacterium]